MYFVCSYCYGADVAHSPREALGTLGEDLTCEEYPL